MNLLAEPIRDTEASAPALIAVSRILHEIGIPIQNKGYRFLRDAIVIALENPDALFAVSKRLYPLVAEKHQSSAKSVERSIGRSIEIAWDRRSAGMMHKYFHNATLPGGYKPTTKEFVAQIVDILQLQM